MPPADNTRFLMQASQQRHRQAREQAEQAIHAAARSRDRPTIVGIAKTAGVSRSWLYTQTDLIEAITRLQQRTPAPTRTGRQPATVESLQQRLDTALERNRQLRSNVADLTRRLEAAHGEIRRLRALGPSTS